MEYSKIKNQSFSKLGLGIMRHDERNFNLTQKIIDTAINNGVNYFESCYFYLNYHCETILAKALANYKRNSYKLCGKLPIHGTLENENPIDVFKKQLRNCFTDYFDVYLLQALDRDAFDLLKKYDVINLFDGYKRRNKIHLLGFSFHDTPEILEKYLNMYDWDVVQLQLNYYDWYIGYGKELYNLCKKYNKPVIVMGPAKGGTLTNNLPQEAKYYLHKYDDTISSMDWCFKFLTTLDNVKIVLSGANNIPMIKQNIEFFSNKENFGLNIDDVDVLKHVIELYKKYNFIQCTGCGYCLEYCPKHLPINKIFNDYNQALNDKSKINIAYNNFKSDLSSFNCIGCGNCVRHCPQHLDIPSLMHNQLFQMRL